MGEGLCVGIGFWLCWGMCFCFWVIMFFLGFVFMCRCRCRCGFVLSFFWFLGFMVDLLYWWVGIGFIGFKKFSGIFFWV